MAKGTKAREEGKKEGRRRRSRDERGEEGGGDVRGEGKEEVM